VKALRGQLIDFLKKIYPKEIEELAVISVFYEYYTDRDIRQALAYLVDKGYVEKKEVPHPIYRRKTVKFYRLTAKGIDLYENTIQDEGVFLPEEED